MTAEPTASATAKSRQRRCGTTSQRITAAIGIAYATPVSGRVMTSHPVKNATAASQPRRRDSRHSSSAYQPASQHAVVVASEKYVGPKYSTIGENSQMIHAMNATPPLAIRRANTNSSDAETDCNTSGINAGQPRNWPAPRPSPGPGEY